MAELCHLLSENLQPAFAFRSDPGSDYEKSRSGSLCEKDRSLQETLVLNEEREFPTYYSDTPLGASNWGTPQTVSPVPSRNGSSDLSIGEDRLLENVKPVTSLSESIGTEDESLSVTETAVASYVRKKREKERLQIPPETTGTKTSATVNPAVDELTLLWTENFGREFKPSKNPPFSRIQKNFSRPKNSSTQSLNLERARNLSGSKSSIDSEQSVSRCESALRLTKLKPSSKTRSTPDVSNIPQRSKSKTTPKHGKLDYSHVKSKVRQYKEEIDALSKLPKAPSPSNTPSHSTANNSSPTRGNLAGNKNLIKSESTANQPKSRDSAFLPPTVDNENEIRSKSLLQKQEFDAIDALMNSLWDKLEIGNKEKRHYKDQYELLDRENAKLRSNLQQLVQAYDGKTCSTCAKPGDDVLSNKLQRTETKSRPSSSTSTSGWITSSVSSHKATQHEECDYDQQSTSYQRLPSPGTLPSDESSTEKFQDSLNCSSTRINEIDLIATGELAKSIEDDEKIYILSGNVVNANNNPKITDDEEELEKAAALLFGNSVVQDNGDILTRTANRQVIEGISLSNSRNNSECSDALDNMPRELHNKNESKDSWQAVESSRKDCANISPQHQAMVDLRNLIELPSRKTAAVQTEDEKRNAKSRGMQTACSRKSDESDANSTAEIRIPSAKNPSRMRNGSHERRKFNTDRRPAHKSEDLQDLMEFLEVIDMLSGSLATESKSLVLAMIKEVQFLESSHSKY